MKIEIDSFFDRGRDAKDFTLGQEIDLELRCRIIKLEAAQIDVTSFGGQVPDTIDGEQSITLAVVHSEMEEV